MPRSIFYSTKIAQIIQLSGNTNYYLHLISRLLYVKNGKTGSEEPALPDMINYDE